MKQLVLIASFLVPLILSAVIIANSGNNKPRKILALSMVNAAFVFIANYFYFLDDFKIYIYLHSLHVAMVLFIYPSIYIYVLSLTQQKDFVRNRILHFVPGFVFLVLYLVFFDLSFNKEARINFLSSYRSSIEPISEAFSVVNWIRLLNVAVILLNVLVYSVAIIKTTRRHTKRLENELSNMEEYKIGWLNSFNFALIIVALFSVIFYVIDPFSQENNQFLIIALFLISVFIWLVGIWGNAQKYVEFKEESKQQSQIGNGALFNIENASVLIKELEHLMYIDKIYLNPELKLDDLVKPLASNRTYISNAINKTAGLNFNQYINKFRFEESKQLIADNPKLMKEDIAIQSGFGSYSSMRRAFLKESGMSPEALISISLSEK